MRRLIISAVAAIALAIAFPGAALGLTENVTLNLIPSGQGPPRCVVVTPGGHTQETPLRACQAVLGVP